MSNLRLGNSANWEPFFNRSFTAIQLTPRLHTPIPEIYPDLLLDKHILAIYCTSNTAKESWYFAGFVNQKLRLGLQVGGTLETDGIRRRKIWLNRFTLLLLPKLTPEYAISFNIPRWYKDITINVWKYIGPEDEPIEDILTRLETRIDAIN